MTVPGCRHANHSKTSGNMLHDPLMHVAFYSTTWESLLRAEKRKSLGFRRHDAARKPNPERLSRRLKLRCCVPAKTSLSDTRDFQCRLRIDIRLELKLHPRNLSAQ